MKRILTILLATSCFVPIVVLVLLGLERLLAALGDEAGAIALGRFSLAGGVVWTLTLIGLLLALAVQSIGSPHDEG